MWRTITTTILIGLLAGPAVGQRSKGTSVANMPPVVIKTEPRAGTTDVDPSTSEIHVTFSKNMQDRSWSWSQMSEETFPETTGKPHYLSDKRTCVLPVQLASGRSYTIWLNSAKFGNFKDTQGHPAVPYLLTFKTSGEALPSPAPYLSEMRTWTDTSNTFSLKARLLHLRDGKVSLKKSDGRIIHVPIEKLSEKDQKYLDTLNPSGDEETIITSESAQPKSTSAGRPSGKTIELANDDGHPAGKKSFPRGHAVGFSTPDGTWYLTGVRIHGSRYGYPAPPQEDFHVWLCDPEFNEIADFTFPYARFIRGKQKWVTLKTKPTKVPRNFVIATGFNATATKGVYISHDESGKSLVGLAGKQAGYFTGGDWLIRANIAPEK